jgi:tetratricopeptide (TPR) repeat protein
VRGLNEVARSSLSLGKTREAISYFEQAAVLLEERGDLHRLAEIQGNLATCLMTLGEYDKAETVAREVKAIFESVENWRGVIHTLMTLGDIQRYIQNYQGEKTLLEQALGLFQQKQLTTTGLLCDLLNSLGTTHKYLKQFELTIQYQQQALDIARETAYHFKLPSILLGLGYSATGLGDFEKAKNYFRECLVLLSVSKVQDILFFMPLLAGQKTKQRWAIAKQLLS